MHEIKENPCRHLTGLFMALIFLLPHYASAAPPETILVLPFNINASEPKAYLQNGTLDMLVSRLTQVNRLKAVTITDPDSKPANYQYQPAIEAGKKVEARYVVFGSITIFSSGLSVDAYLLDVKRDKTLFVFSRSGEKEFELINQLNQLTDEILPAILDNGQTERINHADISQPKPPSTEKGAVKPPLPSLDLRLVTSSTQQNKAHGYWQSKPLSGAVRGIGAGDFDGDNQKEIVLLTKDVVTVYRYANNDLHALCEYDGQNDADFIRVEVADINRNGKAEIFILIKPNGYGPFRTEILEWDGSRLAKVHPDLPYAVNVTADEHGKRGYSVFGQVLSTHDPLGESHPIYPIIWKNHTYKLDNQYPLPYSTNILGFTLADFADSGESSQLLTYQKNNLLVMIDKDNQLIWQSNDQYGLTDLYVDSPPSPGSIQTGATRYYINGDLLPMNCGGDTTTDLVIADNTEALGVILKRNRTFEQGQLECLSWHNDKFTTVWKSDSFPGYFNSQAKGDINDDGKDELLAVNVRENHGISQKVESRLIIWSFSDRH